MNERPLERLNYFNGQRLEASDFKTEQDYHIRVRRWLNKSLYDAGIAEGLGVRSAGEGPFVIVSAGLALDGLGREIILLEEANVEVCSFSGSGDSAAVSGNYLVVEYAEEALSYSNGAGCAVRDSGRRTASTSQIGGPSRVRSQVKFSWVPFPPPPERNQIVLARVELAADCKSVRQIDTGIRRYLSIASATKVKQYAFEGAREVAFIPRASFPAPRQNEADQRRDVEVVGRVYFHTRGRQPNSVTLYLRAEEFSSLYYTEMGQHDHSSSAASQAPETSPPILHPDTSRPDKYKHSHGLNTVQVTSTGSEHDHTIFNTTYHGAHSYESDRRLTVSGSVQVGTPVYGDILGVLSTTRRWDQTIDTAFKSVITGATPHTHTLTGELEKVQVTDDHTHTIPLLSISGSGVGDAIARGGQGQRMLSFVKDLQVFIGPTGRTENRTLDIQKLLADGNPADWPINAGQLTPLGNGAANHVFALKGSGPIRLDFLPDMSFTEDEYCIELRVRVNAGDPPNGGRVLYNLYIE